MAKDIVVGTPGLTAETFKERGHGRFTTSLLKTWTLIRRNPLGFFGLLVIVAFGVIAVLAPYIAPYGLNEFTAGQPNEGMSLAHWFGTDAIGRDVLSRDIYGAADLAQGRVHLRHRRLGIGDDVRHHLRL